MLCCIVCCLVLLIGFVFSCDFGLFTDSLLSAYLLGCLRFLICVLLGLVCIVNFGLLVLRGLVVDWCCCLGFAVGVFSWYFELRICLIDMFVDVSLWFCVDCWVGVVYLIACWLRLWLVWIVGLGFVDYFWFWFVVFMCDLFAYCWFLVGVSCCFVVVLACGYVCLVFCVCCLVALDCSYNVWVWGWFGDVIICCLGFDIWFACLRLFVVVFMF